MIRSKRGLRALGLCALALGLVALYTSASQAEEGASWKVNGKSITAELLPQVAITEVLTKDMSLLTEIAKIKVTVLCTGAQFISARLEAEGKVGGENKVKFTGCELKLNGVKSAACTPHTSGMPAGTLVSNALKGLLMLFELVGGVKDTAILFKPVTGETFLTLEFTGECSIGETCAIRGESSVRDASNEFGVEKVTHLVEQFQQFSDLWVGTKTAEHNAVIDGSGVLELSGEHKGVKWSGTPG